MRRSLGLLGHVRQTQHQPWRATRYARLSLLVRQFVVIISTYAWQRFPTAPTTAGILCALMSGVCGAIGMLFFSVAIKRGDAAIIVTLSAIYPIFIVLLSPLILQEKLSLTHAIGVLLVTLGVILVAR